MHKDIRIHTGGFMTMGTGGEYVHYREKLNTKISNEAYLVEMDDVPTQVMWNR